MIQTVRLLIAFLAMVALIGASSATITGAQITFPTDGTTVVVGTTVSVRSSTSGDGLSPITSKLLVNGVPATTFRPTVPGTYELRSMATDKNGSVVSDPVNVNVITGVAINMNKIPKTAVLGKVCKISAPVSFPDGGRCRLFINGVAASSTWTPTILGENDIMVTFTDNYGNVDSASAIVNVLAA